MILLSRLGSVFVWLSLLNFLDLITDSFPEGLTGVVKVEDQEEGAGQDELEWTRQILDTVQMQAKHKLAQIVAAETDAQAKRADGMRVELDCLQEHEEEKDTTQKWVEPK